MGSSSGLWMLVLYEVGIMRNLGEISRHLDAFVFIFTPFSLSHVHGKILHDIIFDMNTALLEEYLRDPNTWGLVCAVSR